MELLVAFSLGLTGSLHCVGMCGPLMLAAGNGNRWQSAFAYQSGRILVYVLLGSLLGAFGLGMRLWNAQSMIALVSGALLIAFALLRLDPGNMLQRLPAYARFQIALRAKISGFLGKRGVSGQFILGCCNGLLPCGLVYLAVIGAANTSGPLAGAGFMLAFGLGTLPLLTATIYAGRRLFRLDAARLAAATPILMTIAGLLLLYRGWMTHIPYDFLAHQDMAFPPMCH
ncbi:sulfite exporter TauE/SafE family protein [Neolewinella aurantiaca]|uniref:Sulfite exporter TauE/SafE family protein n=1 Tax=Neolewinella aurantiaca TaxID=2602767 RepID=A0A5C7FIQ0_9BACT|nr:sulfite exporter TauE/SafE family protein [Neolewinella aurantiaca]TXF91033.1 sulfite exporter TauE/SafE family protein [Neolewinella aurantiaca]